MSVAKKMVNAYTEIFCDPKIVNIYRIVLFFINLYSSAKFYFEQT